MQMVHLTFISPRRRHFSDDVGEKIESAATSGDGLEHVSVHRRTGTDPVIGLFLRSPSPSDAEHTASRLWRKTVENHPELREYQLFGCVAARIGNSR